jgi:hypothetical protein
MQLGREVRSLGFRGRVANKPASGVELRLIVSPRETYARLARTDTRLGPLVSLRRPLLVAVTLGITVAIAATGHVTPALAIGSTLVMSVIVGLQIAIALLVIGAPARGRVGVPRALDLFFASHLPWSLWMLAIVPWAPSVLGRPFWPIWCAALAPATLTPRMIAAFFREVLGMDARRALARTAAHQALTWGVAIALFGAAVGIYPRALHWWAR